MTIHGSCLCGDVAYEVDGELDLMIHCHCSRCRKAHGAAFATFASAQASKFRYTKGEDLIVSYAPESRGARQFCRTCGGNLPSIFGDRVNLPAGSLDDDPGIRPSLHIFAGSKAAFDEINDDLPAHDEYPPEWMEESS